MGVLPGLLSLGANTPRLYFTRPRTPSSVTAVSAFYSVVAFVTMAALAFGAYALYVKKVEKRTPAELSTRGAGTELAAGMMIGCGLVLSVVGILAAGGYAHIDRTNPWLVAVPGFAYAATAACIEELALRGVVFRIAEERLGTWGALILSAVLFGVLHQSNPNASWISTLTIAVSGGLVLGMAYVLTRRLWLPIGLHFAWNATQAGLGLPVSGQATTGLLVMRISGPTPLTGGSFGVEASVIVLVLASSLTAAMALRAIRSDRITPPVWRPAG